MLLQCILFSLSIPSLQSNLILISLFVTTKLNFIIILPVSNVFIRKLYYTRRSEGQTVTTLHFLTTSHNYPLVVFHSFISTDSLSVIKNRNLPHCSRTQDLNLLESMASALLWRRSILKKPIC